MGGITNMTSPPQNMKIQAAVLDAAMEAIRSEVNRYECSLHRLIDVLESPRPASDQCCGMGPQQMTLDQELSQIHGRLIEATDLLNITIKRIEEQVGELKILP